MNNCKWPLGNGQWLEFIVYEPESTTWFKIAGLYIFSYFDAFLWRPVYVGQTGDFSTRQTYHERWDEARQNGATHIHALWVPLVANRDKWEQMLIEHLNPPLNIQHRWNPYQSKRFGGSWAE